MDFAKFNAFYDKQSTLVDEITKYRKNIYSSLGINVDINDELKKKLLFFDYLMSISICYVELPKYITRNGMHLKSFDKFLCTKNPAIMATWMGTSQGETAYDVS